MDINSIMERNFTEAMRGFKKEEVEEYLGDLAREMAQLKKENEDLEKKLQVCADKIREYREDEDALKDALLGAQKTGNAIIADSKEKAANIIKEAEDNAADRKQEADDYVADRKAEGERIIAEALAEKKRIEAEAQKAADDIHAQMEIQTEIDKEVLARTRREAEDFRTRIIVSYRHHMDFISKIPEECFNEFVLNTTTNHTSNALRELIAAQQGEASPVIPEYVASPEEKTEEDRDSDVKIADSFSGIGLSGEDEEEIEEEIEEEDEGIEEDEEDDGGIMGSFTVENAFGAGEGDDDDTPDFLRSKPNRTGSGNSKYEKLEFGSNNVNNYNSGNNYNNGNRNKKKKR